jgi:GNAT superfamily N-acetyltransferase
MNADSTSISDLADVEAWRVLSTANLALQWEHLPRTTGGRWERWDEVWAADTASPVAFPNSATLLKPLAEGDAADVIARLDQFYAQDTGGPWMLWSAWPTPDLAPYGMRLAGYPPLMVRPPAPLALTTDLRIIEAHGESTLRDFDDAMIHGYPIPELAFPTDRITDERVLGGPMRYFVGYENGRPVACAAAYLGEREVGVYMVATLPGARGKGYGAAMTAATLAVAPELPAVLQASDLGQPVYRTLGFEDISPYTLWFKPR